MYRQMHFIKKIQKDEREKEREREQFLSPIPKILIL